MRKIKKYTALTLALLLLLASLGAFTGCASGVRYDDADSYTAGALSTTETVKRVEIYWESGSVSVSGVLTDKVVAYDTYPEGGALGLHTRLSEGVLSIYPCASGENVSDLSKKLVLKIPYEMANALEEITIETVSADVSLSLVGTEMLRIKTDSGNVDYSGSVETATLETVSGDSTLEINGLDKLNLSTDSGNADVSLQTVGFTAVLEGDGEITFGEGLNVYQNGDIYSYGDTADQLIFKSVSGKISVGIWES